MSVWAVTMVRNEADVIFDTLIHIETEGVDGIVIADNLSDDNTYKEIEQFKEAADIPVIIVKDDDPAYWQGKKMTKLADIAAENGAEWIIPFDADELWCGLEAPLASILKSIVKHHGVVAIDSYTHIETGHDYDIANKFLSMVWRHANVSSLPKVCYRWRSDLEIHQGNDGIVRGRSILPYYKLPQTAAQIRHFPIRSFGQFRGKMLRGAKAIKAAGGLPESWGSHWTAYERTDRKYGEAGMMAVYFAQHYYVEPQLKGFVKDAAPWGRWPRS